MAILGESRVAPDDCSELVDELDDAFGHVRFDQLIIRFNDYPRAPVTTQVLSPWGDETDPRLWVY